MAVIYSSKTSAQASSTQPGQVVLATPQEAIDGVNVTKAVTPAALQAKIDELGGAVGGDVGAVQAELNTTQAAAGLNVNGTYTAPVGSNYLAGATTLKGADVLLDARIKTNTDAIATKATIAYVNDEIARATAAENALDTRLDVAEGEIDQLQIDVTELDAAVVLKASQTEVDVIDDRLVNAESDIDQLQSDVSAIDGRIDALEAGGGAAAVQAELDQTQSSAGLNVNGTYTAPAGSNYLGAATTLKGADVLLDTQIKNRANEIIALDARLVTAEADIDQLQIDVAAKASTATVNAINARLLTAEGEIDQLQLDGVAIDNEITSIESAVGLNVNGTKPNYSSTSFIENGDSHHVAIGKIDQQLNSTQSALDIAEAAIATKAENAALIILDDRVDTVEIDISNLTADVATKASTATVNAINARLVTAEADIDQLQIDVDAAEILIATKAAQTAVDQIEASVGLNANGTYSAHTTSNYINGATTTKGALGLLDAQIKTNADDVSNLATQIDEIIANGANETAVTALQNELDATQSGAGLSITGAYVAHGDASYIAGAISLNNADELLDIALKLRADEIVALDTRIDAIEGDIITLQSDLDIAEAAILTKASTVSVTAIDNRLNFAEGDIDQLQIDLSDAQVAIVTKASSATVSAIDARLVIAEGEIDALQLTSVELEGRLDTVEVDIDQLQIDVSAIDGRLVEVENNYASTTSVTNIQNELDTVELGLGFNINGTKPNYSSSSYILNADSHHTAIGKLDAQLLSTQTALDVAEGEIDALQIDIATKASTASMNAIDARLIIAEGEIDQLQSDLDSAEVTIISHTNLFDTHESAIGLNVNGTYTAPVGGNYVSGASLKASLVTLDTQVKVNSDAIETKASTTSVSNLQSELDATQLAAGINANGTWTAPASNYISASASIKSALTDLDTQVKIIEDDLVAEIVDRANAITTVQNELDTTQANIGLGTDGSYTSPAANHYLGNGTLKLDVAALDAQLFGTQTELDIAESDIIAAQNEINTIESALGLNANGTKPNYSSTQYILNGDTHHAAIGKIDAALAALDTSGVGGIQTEIDAIELGVGLNANGSYSVHVGSNYIDASTSVKDALGDLDTQIKSNADSIVINTDDIAALDVRLDKVELRDGGILLENSVRNEVQFDATLSQWQGFSGPLQVNLTQLINTGSSDVLFGWCSAPRMSDRHLLVQTNGDVYFTGLEA
jgi:hypothetical protein